MVSEMILLCPRISWAILHTGVILRYMKIFPGIKPAKFTSEHSDEIFIDISSFINQKHEKISSENDNLFDDNYIKNKIREYMKLLLGPELKDKESTGNLLGRLLLETHLD